MKISFHREIRDGLLVQTPTPCRNSGIIVNPSAGIYYLAQMSRGWQIIVCRYTDGGDELDHAKFWERHVARALAGNWAVKAAHPFYRLWKLLKEHPHGFPRGRVVDHAGKHMVFHGFDIPKASKVTRRQIESIFGIEGNAKWIKDDHEHCLMADKEAVREVLALEVDWCAV